MTNLQQAFTHIYDIRGWGSAETACGPGSTLAYTENLRAQLPVLFAQFHIQSILDAPCGDFNWMRTVLEHCPGITYTGADIVQALVRVNADKYATDRIQFTRLDITSDALPAADLMICRDCLFHLPSHLVWEFLANFVQSNIKYLLTTSHTGDIVNRDTRPGDFHEIDLLAPPYNFPVDALYVIDDWIPPFPPRQMLLWSRDQLIGHFSHADVY